MAEPWSDDLAELGERTRQGLRSPDATRAILSTRAEGAPQETKMRFFKSHPALAALVAVAVLMLVGGAAYAVVREVFVTIDPDKSAPEIEQDVHSQLEAAGVPATVHADKTDDGRLKLRIMSTDHHAGDDVKISIAGQHAGSGDQRQLRLRLDVRCDLDDAQQAALQAAASGEGIIGIATHRGDKSDADIAAEVKTVLVDAGFEDVDVTVGNGELTITVKSPPAK